VADLRRRLEYAVSLPGSFKNLLDWTVGGGETYGQPVAWINASSRPDPDAGSGAHETLRTDLGSTGADIAAAACRRIQVPRTALGADRMITDAAIQDEVATALRTLADSAAPTSRPARPRTAPGPT
jgi:NAD(P)H-dependent FMN reductase